MSLSELDASNPSGEVRSDEVMVKLVPLPPVLSGAVVNVAVSFTTTAAEALAAAIATAMVSERVVFVFILILFSFVLEVFAY